jgi:hypothetical protein
MREEKLQVSFWLEKSYKSRADGLIQNGKVKAAKDIYAAGIEALEYTRERVKRLERALDYVDSEYGKQSGYYNYVKPGINRILDGEDSWSE